MPVVERTAEYDLVQVAQDLYRITFHLPVTVNCWFVVDAGLTLIDAAQPWNAVALLRAAQRIGQQIARIVITHAHPDHAGAAATLAQKTGARVFIHPLDAPFLTGASCMAREPGDLMCRLLLEAGRQLRITNPPAIKDVQLIEHGQKLGRLEVLHTPGHTPGSITLFDSLNGLLFCGDNVSTTGGALRLNYSWFTLNRATLRQSLQQYLALDIKLLLPGHGPEWEDDKLKQRLSELLKCQPYNCTA